MPDMARERGEFDPPVRNLPSAEHLIIYLIEGNQHLILRFLGASQDWSAIVRAVDQSWAALKSILMTLLGTADDFGGSYHKRPPR